MMNGLIERIRHTDDAAQTPTRAVIEPRLPSVDLLPASVRERLVAARTRSIAVGLAGIVVAGTAGMWWLQSEPIAQAEQAVAAAQTHAAELEAQAHRLQPIQILHDQISRQQAFVSTALASNVQASAVLDRVLAIGRPGATMTAVTIDYQGVPQPLPGRDLRTQLNACPTSNPFEQVITVGCATFSGDTRARGEVVDVLTRAESEPWLVGPFISSTTSRPESGVTFSGTAGIGIDALVTPLTDEQVETLLDPPAAATSSDEETTE